MNIHRRTILQLVAFGRITPAEAERLLIAWNDGRESMWAISACIVITALVQLNPHESMPKTLHIAHSLLPAAQACLHPFLSLVNFFLGGVL
jgi:hypothetical protein